VGVQALIFFLLWASSWIWYIKCSIFLYRKSSRMTNSAKRWLVLFGMDFVVGIFTLVMHS